MMMIVMIIILETTVTRHIKRCCLNPGASNTKISIPYAIYIAAFQAHRVREETK